MNTFLNWFFLLLPYLVGGILYGAFGILFAGFSMLCGHTSYNYYNKQEE